MQNKSSYNLSFRICATALIILHLTTFGPIREALAFSAESARFRLNSGSVTQGGNSRENASRKIFQDAIGEACASRAENSRFILTSGLIATMQAAPPLKIKDIPNLTWKESQANSEAINLEEYFSEPDGQTLTYTVNYLNGDNHKITATIDAATHKVSFSQPEGWFGQERISFVATDSDGETVVSNEVTLQVEEVQVPPEILEINLPAQVNEGEVVTIIVKAKDIDKDRIYFTYANAPFLEKRSWEENGFWYSEATWQTDYHSADTYIIQVTATDTTGLKDVKNSSEIRVINMPVAPHIEELNITPNPVLENNLVTVTARAWDADMEDLSFILDGLPFTTSEGFPKKEGEYWLWQATWQPDTSFAGTHPFTVTVQDPTGLRDTKTAQLIVTPNQPPEIESIKITPTTIKEGDLVTVLVKAKDVEGDNISFIYEGNLFSQSEGFPKKEGDYWLWQATWQTDSKSGGEYTFVIKASDGRLESAQQSVKFSVFGPPPQFQGTIPNFSWWDDETKPDALDLDDYFPPPADGDTLTFSYLYISSSQPPRTIVNIDPETHTVKFSHAAGFIGTETLVFKASAENQSAQSNVITLEVKEHGVRPVIESVEITPETIWEGDLVTIKVTASDADNDDLSFQLGESGSNFIPVARFPKKEGNLWIWQATWQTKPDSDGTYNLSITATDSRGLSSEPPTTKSFQVVNKNQLPEIKSIEITPAEIKEPNNVVITPHADDPDGDSVIFYYYADKPNVNLNSEGPTSEGPTCQWLTTYDDAGTYNIRIVADDGHGGADTETITITVKNTNRAPQATLECSKYSVSLNESVDITLTAFDPDGQDMTFKWYIDGQLQPQDHSPQPIPNHGTFKSSVSFSTEGQHEIKVELWDPEIQTPVVDRKHVTVSQGPADPLAGDFNGDGLTDSGLYYYKTGKWQVAISQKGNFASLGDWLSGFGASDSHEWLALGGDFNADAKSDIGIYNCNNGQLKIALSNGAIDAQASKGSFTDQGLCLTFSAASSNWQPFTGNFNGDKYTDFALYDKTTGEVRIAKGKTGTTFEDLVTWLAANDSNKDCVAFSGDFNGDSLTDLCLFNKSRGEFKVGLSNNHGFIFDEALWKTFSTGFARDKDALLSDFNNDGLTDIGYWEKPDTWRYALSTGAEFVDSGTWLSGFGSNSDDSVITADFDGNGLTDAARFDRDLKGMDTWKWRLSTKKPADLLVSIDNSRGGTTDILYGYAAETGNAEVPFPVYVAKRVGVSDNLPQGELKESYIQEFEYRQGYFDSGEREFRGFAQVKASDPLTKNYTITEFYQGRPAEDGALRGQIKKISAYDGNIRDETGQLVSETVNKYEVKKGGPQDRFLGFPVLVEQVTTAWEENRDWAKTRDSTEYDNLGNPLKEKEEEIKLSLSGKVQEIGKGKISETVYAEAYERGFNRPKEVYLKDRAGQVVNEKHFAYDTRGNLKKDTVVIFNPITQERKNAITQYTYDDFGNVKTTTNAKGATVTTDYETTFNAFPERVVNALNHEVRYEYDPRFGVATKVTDPNNNTTETIYDGLGRAQWVKNAYDAVVTTYSYPDFNTKVTLRGGLTSREFIDGLGRKYKTESSGEDGANARKIVSETYYNVRGQVASESLPHYIDEAPLKIAYLRYEYDTRGRLKYTVSDFAPTKYPPAYPVKLDEHISPDPGDAKSEVQYINPLSTRTIDPQGHERKTLKDAYGNIVEVDECIAGEMFDAPTTVYTYDIQNNLTQTRDRKRNITSIVYDSVGRKLKMNDPDMGEWFYEYDLVGNLIRQTDAKAQVLEFEYDALNRLKAKQGLSPQGTVPVLLASYIYDDPAKENCIGRLSKVIDQSGSTEFFYDKLGREIKSIKEVSGVRYQVSREYDILDRLKKLTYPDGEIINYAYDTNSGLLERVFTTDSGLRTTDYVSDIAYNASGQIKNISYGNGTSTTYTYGQDLRLSRLFTQDPRPNTQHPILQDLAYQFDLNGNLKVLTDNLRNNIRRYNYDELDRLTTASNTPLPTGGYGNLSYKYDSIGNMLTKDSVGGRQYGGAGAGPHALTYAGGFSYRYDANGNMTIGKNKTLEYDCENRLTKVIEPNNVSTFTYDGDGGRVKKSTVHSPQSTETTYIGSLYEVDSDGTIRKHIFAGANRIATKDLVPQGPGPEIYYYHSDHLGSSNVITDQDGKQIQYCEYIPYGGIARNEGRDAVHHKFTGKELDTTGLYFYGARYYYPEIGRFITPDSIVQAPYNPQTFNRYTYCGNNPINYTDPSGHKWSWKKFWHSVVGAVVGVALAIVLGPVGVGMSMAMAGMWGGMVGGALTGGLEGGWKGALMGAAMGGALGAFGGWAAGGEHYWALGGMFATGVGIAAATDSWDSFAGGFVGGLCGAAVGGGITGVYKEQFANYRAGRGFVSTRTAVINQTLKDAASIYGEKSVWVGYGDDQVVTLKSVNPEIHRYYTTTKNINFVENPSWADFKGALTSKYDLVAIHTHGGPMGLQFSDGIHSFSELSSIAGNINAKTVGISACFPQAQSNAWSSLNVSTTNYVDLSYVGNHAPYSDRLQGIQNVYEEVKKY